MRVSAARSARSIIGLVAALAAGTASLRAQVVINEIYFNQPGPLGDREFVELHNPGPQSVDLSGWRLTDGVELVFPPGTSIAANGYLVAAASAGAYAGQAGIYSGGLDNSGDSVVLRDGGGGTIDRVDYDDDDDWPQEADGDGASLELIKPSAERNFPGNWAAGAPPTPGAANRARAESLPPLAFDLRHTPRRVTSSDAVVVTARVFSETPLTAVLLRLDVGGLRHDIPMHDDGLDGDFAAADGLYAARVDALANRTFAKFKVVLVDAASDAASAEHDFPRGDDESDWHAWLVYDNDLDTPAPVIWIFLSPLKIRTLDDNAQVRSFGDPRYPRFDETFPGFVVLDGIVHRKVRIRHRGGFASRHAGRLKYSWRLTFPDWDRYQGRDSIVIQGNMHWDDPWMRGDNGLQDKLCYMTFDRAGVPSPRTRFIRLMVNDELFGYHVEVETIDETFLERNGYSALGDLYKHGRVVQAHNFPVGDYSVAYEKQSNDRSNPASIRTFVEGLAAASGSGTASVARFLERIVDLDRYRRYLAAIILSTHWDSTSQNYFFYQNDLDAGRWVRFPWDMDITWGYSRRKAPPAQGHNVHPYDGTPFNPEPHEFMTSALRGAYLGVPALRQALHDELAHLMVTTFTETEIQPVIARILETDGEESQRDIDKWNARDTTWNWNGFAFHARYDSVYVSSRRKYLAEFLDRGPLLSQASVEPRPAGPGDRLRFVVNALGSRYDGPFDLGPGNLETVKLHLLVDGEGDVETVVPMRAVDSRIHDFFEATIEPTAPAGGARRVFYRFSARDDRGREGWLPDPARQGFAYFALDLATTTPAPGDVVINEILYNARYYDLEFVELENTLWRAVDVSGWKLVNESGIESTLPPGSVLAPRGHLVLSRDPRAVFEFYNIVELAWTPLAFSLDNGDDTLTLIDAAGRLIDRVAYEDDAPWPVAADGGGPSLERIDASAGGTASANWAASARQGTPGRRNAVAAPDIPPQPGDAEPRPRFHRGDVDASGALEVTDAVALLGHLFLGATEPPCRETADANNDASVDLADAVRVLNFLFLGGAPPSPPGPPGDPCGTDPDAPGTAGDLGCGRYDGCG